MPDRSREISMKALITAYNRAGSALTLGIRRRFGAERANANQQAE
jgi:hypothetical protein